MGAVLERAMQSGADFVSTVIHPISKLWGKNRVRILLYHRVCDLPQTDDAMSYLNIPPAIFTQQMALLSRNGFNVITLDEFLDDRDKNKKPPPRTIIITFDDGYRDNYLNAFTILQKYNFRATFFIVTDYIDSEKTFHWLTLGEQSLLHSQSNKQYWLPLGKQDILAMSGYGCSFGSHTKSHCRLNDIGESRAMVELKGSKEHLEEILSQPVRCFCCPYGETSQSVMDWIKAAGYGASISPKIGGNTLNSDSFKLRRIEIYGEDSLAKFERKAEGAYDWLGYLSSITEFMKRVMFLRGS